MSISFANPLTVGVPRQAAPYLYAGIFLLACFASLHYYLYLRLKDVRQRKDISNFLLVEVPVDYWRLRGKHNWSPWPAILIWPVLVTGLLLFVLGIFRL